MASLGGTETSMDAWVVVQASLPGTWEVEAAAGVGVGIILEPRNGSVGKGLLSSLTEFDSWNLHGGWTESTRGRGGLRA